MNKKKELFELFEIMLAVETLEYLDKNYLSGDNRTRSEERQRQLIRCKQLLAGIKTK